MTLTIRVQRTAIRKMNIHASQVARTRSVETIGWLLGFFGGNDVWVCDSVPATRYKSQSRYGAQADAREEVELATQFPRNVGIVGIFHSHPFKDETAHAVFHSKTDDTTLKSRASRHENYLSVVTDGKDAEFFVLRDKVKPVQPEIVDSISYRQILNSYRCPLAFNFRSEVKLASIEHALGHIEQALLALVERSARGDGMRIGRDARTIEIPALQGGAESNVLRISRDDQNSLIELDMLLESVVYVLGENIEELRDAVKNEILDNIVYLLWKGVRGFSPSMEGVKTFEVNLGSFRIHETSPLPKKIFKPPKRAAVLVRGE